MSLVKSKGLRLERIASSPRFKDGLFRNTAPVGPGLKKGTGFDTLGEYFCGGQERNPPAPLPSLDPRGAWLKKPDSGLRLTWLGHSTVVVELDGARLLTDPVWGDRASPVGFAGPKRFQPVPVKLSELPQIDAVVLSHDHYDHLDRWTIEQLAKTPIPFITSLGVGAHLEKMGVDPARITELDWWHSVKVPNTEVVVTAAPSQHFSGRGMADRNSTLWSSFAMKGPKSSVFFSGDTGLTREYAEIRSKLGPFDAVMLEVGAWHEAWGDIHLGPENALKALGLLGGGLLLPVHWGTFNLAFHAWDEPAETLVKLAPQYGASVMMPKLGDATEPVRYGGLDPWWRAVKDASLSKARPVLGGA